MLEAMQEQRVTVLGKSFKLEAPFMVLATQNPVEQEGTYPLPEAQLDRFMSLIELDYPSEAEEIQIARTTTGDELHTLDALMTAEQIIEHQNLVRRVPVPDHIYEYAARLVRKTRPAGSTTPEWLKPLVAWVPSSRCTESNTRCQSAGRVARQLHGAHRRHQTCGRTGVNPSHHYHLRCPGRTGHSQRHHQTPHWRILRCLISASHASSSTPR